SGVSETSTSVDWGGVLNSAVSQPHVKTIRRGRSISTNSPSMAACPDGLIRQAPPGRGSSVASVPIHWTIFAGSVKYSKTLSGLAATRTSCSVRSSVLLRSAAISLGALLLLGDLLQPLQLARQDLGEEVVQLREPFRPHASHPLRAF